MFIFVSVLIESDLTDSQDVVKVPSIARY